MPLSLKSLAALLPWSRRAPHADELYDAIMAQARLPIYYQGLGVPDTLDGRFVMLALHLFAVLHRLKGQGEAATAMAQELSDRFAADMDTVLREVGTGDLKVPKKVRKLVSEGAGLMEEYEQAAADGDKALCEVIAHSLPLDAEKAEATSAQLTPYIRRVLKELAAQPLETICNGKVVFPAVSGE